MQIKLRIILLTLALSSIAHAGLNSLFYRPDSKLYATPRKDGYAFEAVNFSSKDKTKLSGWFIPAKGKALGTVIHFHGNAQNMSAHYFLVSWLPSNGFNLFVFDYRGYGQSEGTPSRKGVYEDSVAAVEYIKTRTDIDQSKIILFGQSLGGANVIAVAGNNRFKGIVGVVSESAFSSYKSIAADHVGMLKPLAPILIGNKFSPKKVIGNISPIPLLIIHGTHDQVVPYKHAEKLFKKAQEPKQLWTIKNGHHIAAFRTYRQKYAPRLLVLFKTWTRSGVESEKLPRL